MAVKKTGRKTKDIVQEMIEEKVDELQEVIDKIDAKLKPYQGLIEQKNRLVSAQRALLGGNKLTGGSNARVRQEDIVRHLREHPGATPTSIAESFGVPYTTIASHLYRGRDERFLNRDKKWWVRDPKEGLNTVDDLPDDDEEEDDEE